MSVLCPWLCHARRPRLLRTAQRCEWASDEMRRKAEHGGVGTPHSRGASGLVIAFGTDEVGSFSWRSCAQLRRLVGSATRRRGGSSAHRPSGEDAWERPRNRSHVTVRDRRTTKPSWGSDTQAGLMRIPVFFPPPTGSFPEKKYYKKREADRGAPGGGVSVEAACACAKAAAAARTAKSFRALAIDPSFALWALPRVEITGSPP